MSTFYCLPGKKVKEWLARKEERIEIFYLLPYSPGLNPDEYLNCDLKAGMHCGKPARSKVQLKNRVISHMRKLQRRSDRVKKYFKHEKILYAAQPIYLMAKLISYCLNWRTSLS